MILKLTLAMALAACLFGQTLAQWDGSGNAQLSGAYNFRQVFWAVSNQRGDLGAALALFGTMTFSGNGSYSLNCQFLNSETGRVQPCQAFTGAYRVNAGGIARIEGPFGIVEALVTNGVLMGGITEFESNDLLIAAKVPGTVPTTASLNGRYWVADFDTSSSNVATFRDSRFNAAFDGAGGIESVQATGYIGGAGSREITQSIGARYAFSSGIGTLSFGGTLTSSNLIAGDRTIFTSADGSFFFGGSNNAFDMLVGIRGGSGMRPEVSGGLYYQAGVLSDQTTLAQNSTAFVTHYSSFLSNGSFVAGHQRVMTLVSDRTYDFTYTSGYALAPDGTYEDTVNEALYAVSADGRYQVGIGKGPSIGLIVAARADFGGTGVFVNPGLILNAASFVPSTAGVSRGGLITIGGSGFASTTSVDGRFPASLGGVLVLINGRPAPLLEVSPTRITAQVPFSVTELTATINVVANGQTSAPVMLYLRPSTPGVFLIGGKFAAALHADFTLVSPEKPALPGETILVYVTGFGDVSPAVAAGTPAPSDSLSLISIAMSALIDGKSATVHFKGLAPGLTGLYQLNLQVPSDVRSGEVPLVLQTNSAILASAVIPIGGIAGQ